MTSGIRAASPRPTILVLGGSSGIGLAVAQLLAQDSDRDADLALAGRDRSALVKAGRSLAASPLLVTADVTDAESVDDAVEQVLTTYGRLDAVVLTAQVMAYGTVEQVPATVFDHVVDTALRGTANVARTVLPVFRAQGHGTLVVVSSLLARVAVPSMSAYVAAKWGQLGLVRSLQIELRDEPDLHVCLVSPGAVDTPIYAQAATYAGSSGYAPPPVVSAERVARAVVACLDRPRRQVDVGPANKMAVLGFRTVPAIYDRLAGPLVRHVVLRGPRHADDAGNVIRPRPDREALSGGWTVGGRLRDEHGRAHWRRRAAAAPVPTIADERPERHLDEGA